MIKSNDQKRRNRFLLEYHNKNLAWHKELMAFEQEQEEPLMIW